MFVDKNLALLENNHRQSNHKKDVHYLSLKKKRLKVVSMTLQRREAETKAKIKLSGTTNLPRTPLQMKAN